MVGTARPLRSTAAMQRLLSLRVALAVVAGAAALDSPVAPTGNPSRPDNGTTARTGPRRSGGPAQPDDPPGDPPALHDAAAAGAGRETARVGAELRGADPGNLPDDRPPLRHRRRGFTATGIAAAGRDAPREAGEIRAAARQERRGRRGTTGSRACLPPTGLLRSPWSGLRNPCKSWTCFLTGSCRWLRSLLIHLSDCETGW